MKSPLNLSLIALVTTSVFLSSQSFSQSSKKEYDHLLWRITGNGLKGTSYLFGTMHVMDKRAFNFGDSLYAAIERSDAYAMELHPDSMMAESLKSESDRSSALVKDVVSAKTFNSARKNLEEKLKQPANKITVKQLRDYYNKWTGLLDPETGMETIIDAYLYNAAKRAGKWVGGIEDVADQLNFFSDYNYEEFLIDLANNTTKSRKYVEEIVRVYTTEALSEFDSFEKTYTTSHPSMIKRNKKMAVRIDSLANIRTTFFAVGAAHLPGDSGVVSLLRKRGFKVEPVISSKKIHATAYKFPEKQLPWKAVKSDSGYYSIEFPAEPQQSEASAESETKVYVDIGTLTIFMTKFVINEKIQDENSVIEHILNKMTPKDSVLSRKPIELDGIKGNELVVKTEEFTFRIWVFQFNQAVYAAIVGGQNSKAAKSIDAERFLNTYKINKSKIAIAPKVGDFVNARNGFSIKFPGKPVAETGDRSAESYSIDKYWYSDDKQGAYFQAYIKNVVKGLYMTNDSAMLHSYVKTLSEKPDYQLIRKRFFQFYGYPAMEAELKVVKDKDALRVKVLYLHRGNRVYVITATNKALASSKITDDFISSFSLIPLTSEKGWSLRTDPTGSFKAWVPEHIEYVEDSAQIATIGNPYFQSYDSLSPATVYVNRSTYPKLFWAISDSSLLRSEVNAVIRKTDSVLSYKFTKNGACQSAEFLVKIQDNSNLRKIRLILNGDTLYALYTFASPEVLENKNYQRFFEDFRLIRETSAQTITKRKTAEFFSALKNADTASIKELKSLFKTLEFDNEDLPILHQAALVNYSDSSSDEPIAFSIFDIIAGLQDASTIDFVKKAYIELPADKEHLRFELLRLLAYREERKSFELIADLLHRILPSASGAYRLYDKLRDTLGLTNEIFPKLLFLLENEFAVRQTFVLSNDLLDKKLVKKNLFDPYLKVIDSIADIAVLDLKDEDDEYLDYYYPLMNFLAKMNSAKSQQWLKKLMLSKNMKTQYYVAYALLANKLDVPAADLQRLAAKNEYRITLYEMMKDLKKEIVFPLQYRTQKAMSQSELYEHVLDSYELKAKKIEYIGERTRLIEGKSKKFLLFKVTIDTGDGTETRLGIAGAYNLTMQPIVTSSSFIGLFAQEAFDPTHIDAQFKAFLDEKTGQKK